MMYRLAAAAGLFAMSAGLALAQTPATTPATGTAAGGTVAKTDKDLKEYQLAAVSKVTLAQALTTAEKQGEKGRAIDADFEKADGKNPNHYSIKVVYPDGKLVEYGINADDGALYKTENQPIERYFTRLKPADFQKATVSLKDALVIAEKKAGGGKAYEAEVEREGASVEYEIKVAHADREQTVKVGPDGKVVD
ncbi:MULTISPECIES: PepSY domain-containing protein [unclassified Methylobacterium]|uniref:PepSY domain-containing protein n=1 Tax=unclassified Methylobacterium TaxID=2615210 RepID=UPI0006F71EA3|nr:MULTISPECIES: PepSY domain-containing protein [unclassified Methylobacterium]KQP93780.1 peptidase M4 [Methylobacterium sp. Leaf113]MCK2056906.1 PepSY domain-containing protein [Methylobacterium sp. 37f]